MRYDQIQGRKKLIRIIMDILNGGDWAISGVIYVMIFLHV